MYIRLNKRLFRFCSAAVAAAVLACTLSAPVPTYADSLSDQYAALQKQQQALQQQIDAQNSQLKTETQKKAALDSSIKLIIQQTSILNNQIAALNTQIDNKNKEIAATQADIDKNYALYKQQLRAMYETGDASYIKVLLTSVSFTDFLDRAEVLKVVSDHNNELLDKLKQDQQKLNADKQTLTASQASLQTSKNALAAKQADVSSQIAQQSAIVSKMTTDVNATKKQQSQIDAELNDIAAQQAAARQRELAAQGGAAVNASASASAIISYAEKYIGCPYVMNAAGPRAFDCSGFTMYVFANVAGVALTHSADDQSHVGISVSKNNLQPGDLVFFNTSGGYGYMSHVGIYIGGDQFIAANTSTGVAICGLFSNPYWSRYYRGATRLLK